MDVGDKLFMDQTLFLQTFVLDFTHEDSRWVLALYINIIIYPTMLNVTILVFKLSMLLCYRYISMEILGYTQIASRIKKND